MQEWRRQENYVFVNVKPMNFFVCQAGAGNLNNSGRKGDKYHSAKAKNDRIRRVIANNSFDLIESKPRERLQVHGVHDPARRGP